MPSISDFTTQAHDEPEISSPEYAAALVAQFGTAGALQIAGRGLGKAAGLKPGQGDLASCLAMVANLCLLLIENDCRGHSVH